MRSFKSFLVEAKENLSRNNADSYGIPPLVAKELLKFKDTKVEGKKTVYVTIYSKDREKTSELLFNKFKSLAPRTESSRRSSFPITIIDLDAGRKLTLVFKPISGGMNESTLNSSITELFPALFWYHRIDTKKPVKEIYKSLLSQKGLEKTPCFLSKADGKSGMEFVNSAEISSKFDEKMKNAVAIYDYLIWLNKQKSIKDIYWTYRAKPAGVDAKSTADIVVRHMDNSLFGVSLKAGGAKTKEPLLNTYVNPIFKFFDYNTTGYERIIWDKVYSKIEGLTDTYKKDKSTFKTLDNLEKSDSIRYNELYDDYLEVTRQTIVAMFNNDQKRALQFLKEKVLRQQDTVPVVIVKAIGSKWKLVEDENELGEAIKMAAGLNAYSSSTSKQQWFLDVIDQDGKTTSVLSVRTNQPGNRHKLGQFSLSVKFNGIK